MIFPLFASDYEELLGKPAPAQLRGWCWHEKGTVTAILQLTPLGGQDWATDGLIGNLPHSLAAAQLTQQAIEDLKSSNARLFVSFADLPGLRPAGTVLFYEASGIEGDPKLATEPGHDDAGFATLVKESQEDSQDFKDIPPAEDILEPYRGHGFHLWRSWGSQGVLMVNPIDNATCHLAFVGLIPRFRSRGHGTHLVNDALKLTGKDRSLTVAVDSTNLAARAIYEKLNFKLTGERPVRFRVLT